MLNDLYTTTTTKGQIPSPIRRLCPEFKSLHWYLDENLPERVKHSLDTSRFSRVAFDQFLHSTFVSPTSPMPKVSSGTCLTLIELLQRYINAYHHLGEKKVAKETFNPRRTLKGDKGLDNFFDPIQSQNQSLITCSIENCTLKSFVENFLLPDSWERLHEIVGDRVILHLLLECKIIISLKDKKGGFLQISEAPLKNLNSKIENGKVLKEVSFSRHWIFHGEAILMKNYHCDNHNNNDRDGATLLAGLPFTNPLNSSNLSSSSSSLNDGSKLDRLVVKIFYFNNLKRPDEWMLQSNTWMIFRNFCTTLLQRHRSCPYGKLLDYHCPDTSRAILWGMDLCGETNFNPLNFKAPTNSWSTHHLTHRKVFGFVKAVLQRVMKWNNALMTRRGRRSCSPALKLILKRIETFIGLRRFESMSIREFTLKISWKELKRVLFLNRVKSPEPESYHDGQGQGHHDRDHGQEWVQSFFHWLIEDFIIPLLKNNFYITETTIYRNRIFYFRHDTWQRVVSNSWGKIQDLLFEPLMIDEMKSNSLVQRSLGTSKLCLIPKETGFRPIINLGKLFSSGQQQQRHHQQHKISRITINGTLRNLYAVLDYHRLFEGGKKMGVSVISLHEVYNRLYNFKCRIENLNGLAFYFVKFDIRTCFDSIPHEQLYNIISSVIDEEEYLIHRYSISRFVDGSVKRKVRRFATPKNDAHQLDVNNLFFKKRFSTLTNALLVGEKSVQKIDRPRLLELLKDHIGSNVIDYNGRLYRQKVGIPQGSILSTLLCSFFHGQLDRLYLRKFMEDAQSLLMRFVDDIIFITRDYHLMEEFIQTISHGFPKFGVTINMSKALASFDHPLFPSAGGGRENYSPSKGMEFFPWCGLRIQTCTLQVLADYSKFFGFRINDSLSIDRVNTILSPASTLSKYLKIYLRPKLHLIFLNDTLNEDWELVAKSIYQNVIHTAIKSYVYIKEVEKSRLATFEADTIYDIISELAVFLDGKVKKNCFHPLIFGTGISKTLLFHGFLELWKRRPSSKYKSLTSRLQSSINGANSLSTKFGQDFELGIKVAGEELFNSIIF